MSKGGKTIAEMRAENPNFDRNLEVTFQLADQAQRDTRTADQLIERYLTLRDHLDAQSKAFSEWAKPLRDEMEQISARVHEMLLALGGDKPSIKTATGTAFTTTTKNPKVLDRDEYIRWCLTNWQTYGNAMLQIGTPKVEAVNEFMDNNEGQLPPFVKIEPFTKVSIRKT